MFPPLLAFAQNLKRSRKGFFGSGKPEVSLADGREFPPLAH